MKARILLAAFLLAVGLCFVPALGYGVLTVSFPEQKDLLIEVELLKAQVRYLMNTTTVPFNMNFLHVPRGDPDDDTIYSTIVLPREFRVLPPDGKIPLDTIIILIRDNSRAYYNRSGVDLLDQFKRTLEAVYSYIRGLATDMDKDIMAQFLSQEGIQLGYFYQGEYHLWEE